VQSAPVRSIARWCSGLSSLFAMSVSPAFMGEYRRDVRRYLLGEMDTYPLLPMDYFEEEDERSLREIEAKARTSR
jgi:hypothetical protein